jgi:hypothetical protein
MLPAGNRFRQLGDTTNSDRNNPVASGSPGWELAGTIAARENHSLALEVQRRHLEARPQQRGSCVGATPPMRTRPSTPWTSEPTASDFRTI